MNADLDDRLRNRLHGAAATTAVPADGRQRVERRIEARRTKRRRVRHTAAAAGACGVLLLAVVALDGPGGDRELTTAATSEQPAPTSPAPAESTTTAPADDQLPRLAVDHPDFAPVLTYVHDAEIDPATAESGAYYIQTFHTDPDAWSLPAVTLHTTRDPGYGIGDVSPSEITTIVDINGSEGYLVDNPRESVPMLGWRLADGVAAHIVAPGVSPDALVEWARTLTLRPDGQGWAVPGAPVGLTAAFDGALSPQRRYVGQELTFGEMPDGADANPVFLDTHRTTPAHHEQRVHDRVHSADHVETTVVRGQPAAVVHYDDEIRVLWSEQSGTVTNELVVRGAATEQLDSIIASLRVLTGHEWDELVENTVGG